MSHRLPSRSRSKLVISGLFALGLLGIIPFAMAESTYPKHTFLVIYRPGPAWVKGKPIRQQPPKDHGKYMLGLFAKGSMKSAGPFTDDTGAAVVLEVASEAEATEIVKADPAVQQGVFLYELRRWEPVDWQKYLKK